MLENLDLVSDIFSKIASTKNGSRGRKSKKQNYFWLFLTPWKSICRNLILGRKCYEKLTRREHISCFIPLDFMDIWDAKKNAILHLLISTTSGTDGARKLKFWIFLFFSEVELWRNFHRFSETYPVTWIRWFWLELPIWWSRDLS